jgi:hypothetical protein
MSFSEAPRYSIPKPGQPPDYAREPNEARVSF